MHIKNREMQKKFIDNLENQEKIIKSNHRSWKNRKNKKFQNSSL